MHPSLAVSMKLLRLAQLMFLHLAPNRTGFVQSFQCFLSELSYDVPKIVSCPISSGRTSTDDTPGLFEEAICSGTSMVRYSSR